MPDRPPSLADLFPGRLTLTLAEAAEVVRISRGAYAKGAAKGRLPVLDTGTRRKPVPVQGLQDYLDEKWSPRPAPPAEPQSPRIVRGIGGGR